MGTGGDAREPVLQRFAPLFRPRTIAVVGAICKRLLSRKPVHAAAAADRLRRDRLSHPSQRERDRRPLRLCDARRCPRIDRLRLHRRGRRQRPRIAGRYPGSRAIRAGHVERLRRNSRREGAAAGTAEGIARRGRSSARPELHGHLLSRRTHEFCGGRARRSRSGGHHVAERRVGDRRTTAGKCAWLAFQRRGVPRQLRGPGSQ